MTETPIIVISSCGHEVGKTTVALNLSAALWSDGYNVKLFAPDNYTVSDFLSKRKQMNLQCKICMPMPQIVENVTDDFGDNAVTVAIIPNEKNEHYTDIFAAAHTLLSIGCEESDFDWSFSHPYINLIWQAKKTAAAKGVKYFNWIAVQNMIHHEKESLKKELEMSAKQLGFRVADPLYWRGSYRYVTNGYCAADMAKYRQIFKMSMDDVYARREILNLTDDLWKHK